MHPAASGGNVEVHPGVFVSNIATDQWEPDPEVGGEMHILVGEPDGFGGMTRYDVAPEPTTWTVPERETLLVLEGGARIEIADGPTLELKAGDMASMSPRRMSLARRSGGGGFRGASCR